MQPSDQPGRTAARSSSARRLHAATVIFKTLSRFTPWEKPVTTLAENLSRQAAQLPPAERMELVERILDSLIEPAPQLDALWAREAESRLEAYRSGELHAVSLAEVLARYRADPASR